MTPTLTIHATGTPAPQGSKRAFVVNGRAVLTENSSRVKPWREDVHNAAHTAATTNAWTAPNGPLRVQITFYLPRPGYHYGTGRNAGRLKPTAPTYVDKKPDLDKLTRSTLDALTTSGVIRDDSQIVGLALTKAYADHATGARITITPLDTDEPALNGVFA